MSSAPIMVRAAITPEEWMALRILAMEQKRRTADLIAEAIRTHLLPERTP